MNLDRSGRAMQLYLILYPSELEEEILQTLEACGLPGYTEFPKLVGRGPRSRHFDNPVWPGAVGGIFTVISAEQAPTLVEPFQALNRAIEERSHGRYGLHVFALPCSQLV